MSMTDYQRTVLNHYNLSNPFPVEWPAEKDQLEEPHQGISFGGNPKLAAQFRRHSVLDFLGSERLTSSPKLGRDGTEGENAIRADEPDPLGAGDSVVRLLRQRGLPVDDDAQLSKRKTS